MARALLVSGGMPPTNRKDSQNQEFDEEREIGSAHRDSDADDDDERAPQKSNVHKNEEERDEDSDDEDTAQDIDLDDLQAMEGPDA